MQSANQFTEKFKECSTLSEAKKVYWQLAKENHPDRGGSNEAMKALNEAFNNFSPVADDFGNAKQSSYKFYDFEGSQDFIAIIERLLSIAPDCFIEVVGDWIWITGDTYSHKQTIKASVEGIESYKARFSKKKTAWYISPADYRKKSKREYSLDEIRATFGSEQVAGSGGNRIKGAQ